MPNKGEPIPYMGFTKRVYDQGRTFKFCLGGCQHVLDRLNFFEPTRCIQAVRTLDEL